MEEALDLSFDKLLMMMMTIMLSLGLLSECCGVSITNPHSQAAAPHIRHKLRDKFSNSYKRKRKITILYARYFDVYVFGCESGIKAFPKRRDSGIPLIKSAPKFAKIIFVSYCHSQTAFSSRFSKHLSLSFLFTPISLALCLQDLNNISNGSMPLLLALTPCWRLSLLLLLSRYF